MTQPQIFVFVILAATMGLFVWGRLRYDVVALLSLLASVAVGVVPYDKAFSGFSDDIVVIVASALLVSAAVERSGLIDTLVRPLAPRLTHTGAQVTLLAGTVATLSAFVKNIGALAMLMPLAFQLARRNKTPVGYLLMPMAFAALLGGTITLIGTSPNIVVSRVRQELVGTPFSMFDFAPVGLCLTLVGVIFLAFGWRLLPAHRKGAASIDEAFNLEGYTTEVTIPEDSSVAGKTVAELAKLSEDEVEVLVVLRARDSLHQPPPGTKLRAGYGLILQGQPAALERMISSAKLKLMRDTETGRIDAPDDDIGVMEAIVTADSPLVDRTATQYRLHDHHQVNLLALSRSGRRIMRQLGSIRIKPGDVVVLQGNLTTLPETLGELRCLPLAERKLALGRGRRSVLPVGVLAIAMVLAALNIVPVAIAFFGAATLILLLRAMSLRDAYAVIEWPILIMLGALIPVSDALRTSGGTDLIAHGLSVFAQNLPPLGMLALMMAAAMAVTPFLNNAATVLVMAPIAAAFAKNLGYSPDPFLMAVAIGAASDFLTPIGHQCNTLVMGAGGYQFGDYWKLGLPLSILVLVLGVPLIALVWPFAP
jgi:di/tricarboxylate transporter